MVDGWNSESTILGRWADMVKLDFTTILEKPETDGNLAIDEFAVLADSGDNEPLSSSSSAIPEATPVILTLPAQYRPLRMDKLIRDSILRAFTRNCEEGHISLTWGRNEQGRSRVKLLFPRDRGLGLADTALSVELNSEPWMEAALLLELAKKEADLAYILDERAAIRAADGLPDDDMTVALLTIGADERMAEWESERAEFEAKIG